MSAEVQPRALDPVTFEIVRNAFQAVCNEIGITLMQVAFSPVVTEGKDFTGALYTPEGHLVAVGELDQPGLNGSTAFTIRAVLDQIPLEEIHEGDVIFANIPHEGGTHLNDVRAFRPVFWRGEMVGFVGDLTHWSDVGGATPGSINMVAPDCIAEGLNIPPIKLVEAGHLRRDVLELILKNVRISWETRGDIHAMIKGLEVGERRLQDLCRRYELNTIRTAFNEVFAYSERMFFHDIRSFRDGTYYFEDRIDRDILSDRDDPVVVRLTFTKKENHLTFDFSKSDPDPKAAVGSPRPFTCAATYVALLNLCRGIPFNHGIVRNVDIITRPGTVVHALFPSSVSGGTAGAQEKVTGAVFGALGQADPSRAVACSCNLNNVIVGGYDPRLNRPYVFYVWNEGGYGASARGDAPPTPMIYPYASGARNQPVEVHERSFPMRFHQVTINYRSCGAGKFRGGPGIIHRFEITDGEAKLNVWGDRERFAPWGIAGGRDGGAHGVWVNRGTEAEKALGMYIAGHRLKMGDTVEIHSGGGGGYGDPLDRDPALVLRDVEERTLDVREARETFGVAVEVVDAVGGHYRLNETETVALRAGIGRRRLDVPASERG
jgi:N-methylhydantoinase B